jgi:hypothetical protein
MGEVIPETWANFIELPRCEFPIGFDEWARPQECEKPAEVVAEWADGKMYLCQEHADMIYDEESKDIEQCSASGYHH